MNRLNCEKFLIDNNFEPITELQNELTKTIDLSQTGQDILNHLSRTDLEIFNGWQINTHLKTDGLKHDLDILNKITQISQIVRNNLNDLVILFSGCGTSGRVGYLYSQRLNEYFSSTLSDYILAGGEYALVNSVESIEDKPEIGIDQLKIKLAKYSDKKIIYFGITCGLSAPFVAGQLDYLLSNNDSNILATCLIGFNPVLMARNTFIINSKNETFLDLIKRMQHADLTKFYILNPLIGPEPITGSTRMKSGTTTKLILDLIITQALHDSSLTDLITYYEKAHQLIYSNQTIHELGQLIDISAECLRQSGSINYLSSSERLGLLCCVDASECIPTYGSKPNDFKGFISSNKWTSFSSNCLDTKTDYIVNNLTRLNASNNLFIIIDNDEINLTSLVPNAYVYKLNFKWIQELLVETKLKVDQFFKDSLEEFALKLIVNSISTGAHVLIGKVYENLMIDVKVSNFKLYQRAIKIIQNLSQLTLTESEINLLKSIYETDELRINIKDIDTHIKIATNKDLIVPKALVISLTQMSYAKSSHLVSKSSVRNCLQNLKK